MKKEDAALFREAVAKARPLRHDRVAPERPKPAPLPTQRWRDESAVMHELLSDTFEPADIETGDELIYQRAGVQHSLMRRLRRGQFSISAELDLHGYTVPEARQALTDFLQLCSQRGLQCVRIIHGKGYGSRQKQPVLKGKLNIWLRHTGMVLAFCSARPVDGGTGAVYVLLKRPR